MMQTLAYTDLSQLGLPCIGQTLLVRGYVHTKRDPKGVTFMTLRKGLHTVQAVAGPEFAVAMAKVDREAVIDVLGKVVASNFRKSTVQGCELQVLGWKLVAGSEKEVPIIVEDAMRSEEEAAEAKKKGKLMPTVGLDVRLDNRVLDLRALSTMAVFRIQSGVCQLFREYVLNNGFVEIHTPKLLAGSSEGGSAVFRLKYFDRDCSLAQSPQLYKQMAVLGGLEKVFEIGPVFRAEASDTHRHLCEFTGLDAEMEIKRDYREILQTYGKLLVYMFNGLRDRFVPELAAVQKQYHFEPLVYREETLVLDWDDAVRMVHESGGRMGDFEDFNTENEVRLGKVVKEKYGTDFYIVTGFPSDVRPFYTKKDPRDDRHALAFDAFLRGEEITSGAQRVSDFHELSERSRAKGVQLPAAYLNAFRYGAVPHGGFGIGLERVVMLYLNIGNVRKASLFPRDPMRLEP